MKKLKHSKYKNTGILFEMLVRKLTSETMSSDKTVTIDIIKKYFGKNSSALIVPNLPKVPVCLFLYNVPTLSAASSIDFSSESPPGQIAIFDLSCEKNAPTPLRTTGLQPFCDRCRPHSRTGWFKYFYRIKGRLCGSEQNAKNEVCWGRPNPVRSLAAFNYDRDS